MVYIYSTESKHGTGKCLKSLKWKWHGSLRGTKARGFIKIKHQVKQDVLWLHSCMPVTTSDRYSEDSRVLAFSRLNRVNEENVGTEIQGSFLYEIFISWMGIKGESTVTWYQAARNKYVPVSQARQARIYKEGKCVILFIVFRDRG